MATTIAPLALAASLEQLEEVIARGLAAYRAAGVALLSIRDRRLYASAYPTFTAYCRDRWDLGASYAYSICSAAEVADQLEQRGLPAPASEGVARELVRVYRRTAGWRRVSNTAGRGSEIVLEDPAAGLEAAAAVWERAVRAHADRRRPITGAEVRHAVAGGESPAWGALIGGAEVALDDADAQLRTLERLVGALARTDRATRRLEEQLHEERELELDPAWPRITLTGNVPARARRARKLAEDLAKRLDTVSRITDD